MRTITCLFFGVTTLLLGNIRAGVGQPSDALPPIAAFVFLIAAIMFAFLDWPGLPRKGVEIEGDDHAATRRPAARDIRRH